MSICSWTKQEENTSQGRRQSLTKVVKFEMEVQVAVDMTENGFDNDLSRLAIYRILLAFGRHDRDIRVN